VGTSYLRECEVFPNLRLSCIAEKSGVMWNLVRRSRFLFYGSNVRNVVCVTKWILLGYKLAYLKVKITFRWHIERIQTLKHYIKYISYCTVLAVLVGFTEHTTQLFTIFYCRLHESVLQLFFTVDSDPLISCLRTVFRCPLASKAGCWLTDLSSANLRLIVFFDWLGFSHGCRNIFVA
jgi:hypothetical protein